MATRTGSTAWRGSMQEGKGAISTENGALQAARLGCPLSKVLKAIVVLDAALDA